MTVHAQTVVTKYNNTWHYVCFYVTDVHIFHPLLMRVELTSVNVTTLGPSAI